MNRLNYIKQNLFHRFMANVKEGRSLHIGLARKCIIMSAVSDCIRKGYKK